MANKLSPKPPFKKGKNNRNMMGQFGTQIILSFLIFIVLIGLYSAVVEREQSIENIPISQLSQDIKTGVIERIVVKGDEITATYTDEVIKESRKEDAAALTETLTQYGVTTEQLNSIEIDIENPVGTGTILLNILPFLLPIIFIVILFWYVSRQMKGSSMQAFSFGQSKARMIDPNDKKQKILFKDIAGVKEAKEELTEIVDFLRQPKKFLDIGASIPKGVLLMGSPGTGKTLLARAVAGEAHVPFFYLSGSEFVEMFVGVGASRVRDLFKMAKKTAPSIIFIDEIDAIGRHRGSGMGGGNDEREQTLNQILVEMDGFEPNEKLIVMAATNRPDVLDPALLRPGRFDRRVMLDQPDINDREQILKIHTKKKPLADDVDLRTIAERTPGFSGADLANVMNEAAILAARQDKKTVSQDDFVQAVEKVMLGPERKSHILSEHEKKITAYHEMGHALVASVLEHSDPVHKVSIISRGYAAGYTLKLPFEDKKLNSRREFLDDIAMSLGGYAAERMIFDDITTGAANDIKVATTLAHDMVTKYGMSDKLGPVGFSAGGPRISRGEYVADSKSTSEATQSVIDNEVSKIMNEALARAENVLTDHKKVLDDLSEELIKVETIERQEFEKMLKKHGITPKSKDTPAVNLPLASERADESAEPEATA